jgi:hypothetical protein
MLLVTANKPKQLLYLSFIGKVDRAELARCRHDVEAVLSELSPGFRLLADLGRLESMTLDCAPEIASIMELCDAKEIGEIVRVIPDPSKDIGLNIFSYFHYKRRPRVVVYQNILEAAHLVCPE